MLIQFSVSNYASIRDQIVLSMVADNKSEQVDSVITAGNEKLLPVVTMFGANAAGKSNINKALTAAILAVRMSHNLQVDSSIPLIIPFLFDETSKNQPSKFDFIFFTNETKYQYGFTADQKQVYEEYLYKYSSSWPSKIFERTQTNKYVFTQSNEDLRVYVDKTTDNKLFLSTATKWNCQKTKEAYMWFAECIDSHDPQSLRGEAIPSIYEQGTDIKPFIQKMLKYADFNIADYSIEAHDVPFSSLPKGAFPPGLQIAPDADAKLTRYEVSTCHVVEKDGVAANYNIPFELESEGTKKFFELCPAIKKALDNGYTMIVDEMDSSIHPLLLDYIVDLFNDKNINTKSAQLIFNSHSINLMSLDKLRRDQIYFVEKSKEGVTELFALDEFSPRNNENIRKKYLEGRYGALPNIMFGDM